MTNYKIVISWLVFLSAIAGSVAMHWSQLNDLIHSPVAFFKSFLPGSGGGFSFGLKQLWQLTTFAGVTMIMSPWLRPLLIRLHCVAAEGSFTENISFGLNTAGRWLVAACIFPSPLIFFSAFLIAPELALLFSSGFTGFIDSVFFPGGREKKPPYTLKLARFYVQKQRWDDAEAEYARMLSFYPQELEAWQESLRVAFAMGEHADPSPDEILSRGLKKLPTAAGKEALFATFNAREKPVILPETEEF